MSGESFWERFNEGKVDRRTFIKVASLMGGAAVFGLPLLGCQPSAPTQTSDIKMAISTAMLSWTPVYSGGTRNIFQQDGLKTALTEFAGGADQVRAVVTGGYDIAGASTAAMTALESGEPARLIAGGYNASSTGFIVRADSPFKKPEDLKGKKIKVGYSRPGAASHIVAFLGLKAVGIDPDDKGQVEFVATGGTPDTWTALKSGMIDVGWSTEPTISDVEAKKEGRLLWMTWDLVKDWADAMIMTTQPVIDRKSKELKAWVNSYIKAIDWVKNNYSEAAKDLAHVIGVDPALAEAAMKRVPRDVWSAAMPKRAVEGMAKASVQFKLLKAMPDLKVLVNQSFLPENLRDVGY